MEKILILLIINLFLIEINLFVGLGNRVKFLKIGEIIFNILVIVIEIILFL